MAIVLEFHNFIVPMAAIRDRYPGGWAQCLRDHENVLGGRVYFDEHLFRDGAMGPEGITALLQKWSERGFEPTGVVDGREVSKDVCILSVFGGKLWPCDWVTRSEGLVAHYTGTEPGPLVGPRSVQRIVAAARVKAQLGKIATESAGPG